MSTVQLEIQVIAVLTAMACALPGTFLVLRRLSLVGDAISHAILLGIVLAFFAVESLTSPLLLVGAALTGLLTVLLVEVVKGTGLVREDAAIGLVFPALFSVAVVLIARYADSVHLDTDVVLLGELAFAPFERFEAFGWDWAPKAMVVMGGILLLNVVVIALFYKELKLVTFDAGLAVALGFSPAIVHYGLMGLVSVTAVGAFDAVGSILVVALMIAPPAAAYLLTDRLHVLLVPRCGHRCRLRARGLLGGSPARRLDRGLDGLNDRRGVRPGVPVRAGARPGGGDAAACAAALGVRADDARHPPAEPRGPPRGCSREPGRAPRRAPALAAGVRAGGRRPCRAARPGARGSRVARAHRPRAGNRTRRARELRFLVRYLSRSATGSWRAASEPRRRFSDGEFAYHMAPLCSWWSDSLDAPLGLGARPRQRGRRAASHRTADPGGRPRRGRGSSPLSRAYGLVARVAGSSVTYATGR